jgi:hypothetical protein
MPYFCIQNKAMKSDKIFRKKYFLYLTGGLLVIYLLSMACKMPFFNFSLLFLCSVPVMAPVPVLLFCYKKPVNSGFLKNGNAQNQLVLFLANTCYCLRAPAKYAVFLHSAIGHPELDSGSQTIIGISVLLRC